MRRAAWLIAAAVAASAQPPRGNNPEGLAEVEKEFAASGLKQGSPFPALRIHDAEGKPFDTRSFRGRYTVLVAGCLT